MSRNDPRPSAPGGHVGVRVESSVNVRAIVVLGLIVVGLLLLLPGMDTLSWGPFAGTSSDEAPAPPQTQSGGAIVLETLSGEDFDVTAETARAPLVLAIWLPGCGDCVPHLPTLETLYTAVRERGVRAVAVTYQGTPENSRRDVEGSVLESDLAMDRAGLLTGSLGVQSITVFVYDGKGGVPHRFSPPFDDALATLDELLETR